MKTIVTKREIEKFRELGLLDEIAYRNRQIRIKFHYRKKFSKKKRCLKIKVDLAAEYCLSIDTIHKAIYNIYKRKKVYLPE